VSIGNCRASPGPDSRGRLSPHFTIQNQQSGLKISVASQLRTLAAWNLRVKSLLLMRLPYAAEAGFGMTPTVLWRASSEHEEGKGQEQGDGEKIRE
jgi:hypothetical protein